MTAVQALTGSGGWPMSVWLTPDARAVLRRHVFPAARRRPRRAPRLPDGAARRARRPTSPIRSASDAATAALVGAVRSSHGSERRRPRAAAARRPRRRRCSPTRSTVFKRAFDDRDGGVRRAPKFPSNMPVRLLLRAPPPHGRRRGAADGGADAREDGGRRHLRPARRRLSPLLDRRALAGPALREDALRQRAARRRLPRGVPGDRARRLRARRARDAGLRAARDDRARRRRSTRRPTPTRSAPTASRRRALLRLVRGRDPRRCSAPAPTRNGSSAITASRRTATSRARASSPSPRPSRRQEHAALAAPARRRCTRSRAQAGRRPFRDDKILAAWNGLMISALAVAGRVLGEPRYVDAAARAATFVLDHMRPGGRLARSSKDGRAGGRRLPRRLRVPVRRPARSLRGDVRPALAARGDRARATTPSACSPTDAGGWFMTAADHERLLAREKPAYDGAEPSGTSVALLNALRLATFTGDDRWRADRRPRVRRASRRRSARTRSR